MSYLHRNRRLIEEIRQIPLKRGALVGKSKVSNTTFTAVGSYKSEVLGRELFLGVKEYQEKFNVYFWNAILPEELAILERISKSSLGEEIPVVYGHLRDREDRHIGVLCEDFSQGRRFEVREISPHSKSNIPIELRETFGATRYEMDDVDILSYVGFMVNGQRRLGDFNSLLSESSGRLIKQLKQSRPFK